MSWPKHAAWGMGTNRGLAGASPLADRARTGLSQHPLGRKRGAPRRKHSSFCKYVNITIDAYVQPH